MPDAPIETVTEPLHWVTVAHELDVAGNVTSTSTSIAFECRGDQTSGCHLYPACDCEWYPEDHVHPDVVHEECWIAGWFRQTATIFVDEDGEPVRDVSRIPARRGPIEHELDEVLYWSWDLDAAVAP